MELPPEVIDRVADLVAARLETHRGPEPWIDVRGAAQHLACKPQRVYDLVHRKDETRLPHRKEGSRLLFRASELDAWLDANPRTKGPR
jgi:hypothetical protein